MNTPHALLSESPWFFLAFPLMWLAVCALLSLLGGWISLAREYRATGPSKGAKFFTSGSVGWPYFPVRYGGCLVATVNADGLRLGVLFPFRFLHPPLYFPWKAVESLEVRTILFITGTLLEVRGFGRRITLHGQAAAAVCQSFDNWQASQPRRAGAAVSTPRKPPAASANPVVVGLCYGALVFAFFAIAINFSSKGWAYWYRLTQVGRTTTATITQIDLQNHRLCRFVYQVGGRTFDGSESCPSNIGARVTGTYLPDNPAVATIRSARDELYSIIFGPLLMACFAGIVTGWRSRSSAKALAAASSP